MQTTRCGLLHCALFVATATWIAAPVVAQTQGDTAAPAQAAAKPAESGGSADAPRQRVHGGRGRRTACRAPKRAPSTPFEVRRPKH